MNMIEELTAKLEQAGLQFTQKPILIGGQAMEYYGTRKSGEDIDLVICEEDYLALAAQHPDNRKDLYGDLGVILWPFEIWRSIALLDYDFYKVRAIEYDAFYVIALDRLLLTRVVARDKDKYNKDLDLLLEYYYEQFRNRDYLANAETHVASYNKNEGTVIGGNYED